MAAVRIRAAVSEAAINCSDEDVTRWTDSDMRLERSHRMSAVLLILYAGSSASKFESSDGGGNAFVILIKFDTTMMSYFEVN